MFIWRWRLFRKKNTGKIICWLGRLISPKRAGHLKEKTWLVKKIMVVPRTRAVKASSNLFEVGVKSFQLLETSLELEMKYCERKIVVIIG